MDYFDYYIRNIKHHMSIAQPTMHEECLRDAIITRSIHEVAVQLNEGADVNTKLPGDDISILHYAVRLQAIHIVQLLLSRNAEVENKRDMWNYAIHRQHSTEMFRLLLTSLIQQQGLLHPDASDVDLNEIVWGYLDLEKTNSFLYGIFLTGSPDILSVAIAHGVPLGKYPLYKCLDIRNFYKEADYEMFRILISVGASLDTVPNSRPILELAIQKDRSLHGDLVRNILEHGGDANINSVSEWGTTALKQLIVKKYRPGCVVNFDRILSLLLSHGADVTLVSHDESPLYMAIQQCKEAENTHAFGLVEALLSRMRPDQVQVARSPVFDSPLLAVTSLRYNGPAATRLVRLLIAKGADPSAACRYRGRTPLYQLILRSWCDAAHNAEDINNQIMILIEAGVDPRVFCEKGFNNCDTVADLISQLMKDNKLRLPRPVYKALADRFDFFGADRVAAVMMGLHPRLGGESWLNQMPLDMMRTHLIPPVNHTIPPIEN